MHGSHSHFFSCLGNLGHVIFFNAINYLLYGNQKASHFSQNKIPFKRFQQNNGTIVLGHFCFTLVDKQVGHGDRNTRHNNK